MMMVITKKNKNRSVVIRRLKEITFHIRFHSVSDPKNGHKWRQLQARHAEAQGSRVTVAGR